MLSGVFSKDLGWIEVITGSMFSGKTEELIRRLKRAQIAKQKVAIFKPQIDTRYSDDHIISHSEQKAPSITVASASEIPALCADAHVVAIDEGQFFGADLATVCEQLASEGKRVIVAGLDQDFRGMPFEPMPQIMAIAESVTKTLAICVRCGNPANRTQRISADKDRVVVGAIDMYEARCRNCYRPPEST
jgi:thymidine kinase